MLIKRAASVPTGGVRINTKRETLNPKPGETEAPGSEGETERQKVTQREKRGEELLYEARATPSSSSKAEDLMKGNGVWRRRSRRSDKVLNHRRIRTQAVCGTIGALIE